MFPHFRLLFFSVTFLLTVQLRCHRQSRATDQPFSAPANDAFPQSAAITPARRPRTATVLNLNKAGEIRAGFNAANCRNSQHEISLYRTSRRPSSIPKGSP